MTMAEEDTAEQKAQDKAKAFWDEVMDAKLVLEFAVASGFRTADGRKLDDATIAAIKKAEDMAAPGKLPPADARTEFEKAYRDLTLLMAPITAETLRATSDDHPVRSWITLRLPVLSEAKMLFWKLVFWTILFVAIAFAGSLFSPAPPPQPYVFPEILASMPGLHLIQRLLSIFEPFTYGGIGACAYLLKACIGYIQRREFDPMHELEYYSRILLGVVSGGMVVLLVVYVSGDGNQTFHLSAAALGLLAGYNTDFLFSAIERIIAAILPKVGTETVQRQPPPAVAGGDVALIKDLLTQLSAATDPEDKKTIQALLDKIKDRL